MACRKTAVSARRVALQMIQNTIVCAPDGLRDQLRSLTRMQLVRTLASWRPDLTAYRDLDSAYRIGLKSLARRYLELHDEIADLAACRTEVWDFLGGADFGPLGRVYCVIDFRGRGEVAWGALAESLEAHFGQLRPPQAGLRANIGLMFQAMVTRLHSPRARSSPRIEN